MENKTKASTTTDNIDQNQLFKLLVVVAALLALLFVAYQMSTKSRDAQPAAANPQLAEVEKVNVDYSQAPEKFPADIPIEPGAQITQNYNATSPDGRFQATRTFVTEAALATNLRLYTEYLTNNGWEIKATTDNPTYKMVMGAKGNQSIQVSIDENKVTKIKTVSISYTETK